MATIFEVLLSKDNELAQQWEHEQELHRLGLAAVKHRRDCALQKLLKARKGHKKVSEVKQEFHSCLADVRVLLNTKQEG